MATSGSFNFSNNTYTDAGWPNHAKVSWSALWNDSALKWTVSWTAVADGASNATRWVTVFDGYVTVTDANGNTLQTVSMSSQIAQAKNNTELVSGTFTVGTDSLGNQTLTFAGQFHFEHSGAAGLTSGSGTYSLDQKALASTISSYTAGVGVSSSGGTSSVSISANSSSYTHTVKWAFGSYSYTATLAAGVTSASYTIPASWLAAIPSSATGTGTITLTTYYNGTAVGSVDTKSFTITANVYPSIGSFTFAPRGTAYNAGITSVYIAGYSTALLTASSVAGVNGSSISKYEFLKDGSVLATYTSSATSYSHTTGTLTGTSATFAVRVTDTRGRQSIVYGSAITIKSYAVPSITASAYRSDSTGTASNDGTYLRLTASASATPTENSITALTYAYKLTTASSYGSETSVGSGVLQSGFANTSSYDVRVTATDTLGNSAYKYFTIPTAEYTMDFKVGGKGVAFGKVAETDDLVDSEWDIQSAGDITAGGKLVVQNTAVNGSQVGFNFTDYSNLQYGLLFLARSNYGGRFILREYSGSASGRENYWEQYQLPYVDVARTTNASYDILTTKGAGTVSGATSSHTINAVNIFSVPIGGYCRIIEVNAVITLTSAVSNGSVLMTGLPIPLTGAGWWFETVFASNINGTMYQLKYGVQSGASSMEMQSAQSIASGTQIRIHFVYFAKP